MYYNSGLGCRSRRSILLRLAVHLLVRLPRLVVERLPAVLGARLVVVDARGRGAIRGLVHRVPVLAALLDVALAAEAALDLLAGALDHGLGHLDALLVAPAGLGRELAAAAGLLVDAGRLVRGEHGGTGPGVAGGQLEVLQRLVEIDTGRGGAAGGPRIVRSPYHASWPLRLEYVVAGKSVMSCNFYGGAPIDKAVWEFMVFSTPQKPTALFAHPLSPSWRFHWVGGMGVGKAPVAGHLPNTTLTEQSPSRDEGMSRDHQPNSLLSSYIIHGSIQETINPDSMIPVTLLTTDEIFGDLEAQLRLFDVVDDVFIPEFGGVLVEKPGGNGSALPLQTGSLGGRELYHLNGVRALDDVAELPSGPYFLHGPNLYQAWKLYDDIAEAFTTGVIPEDVNKPDKYVSQDIYSQDADDARFLALRSLSTDGAVKSVPVPSRLYHPPPHPELPLSGVRVAVTESLPLNGLFTTLSSRAWSALQISPAHTTDTLTQVLLEMGAVIVGKTKTSQFDVGQDWVDYTAPWSPRADGYQTPGGTSAGASVALASYDWLQYAIAKDSRNVLDLFDMADATLDLAKYEGSLPRNLIFPSDFFANSSQAELELQKQFVTTLENFLGIKSEPQSLTELWLQKPPIEAAGQGMQEFLDKADYKEHKQRLDVFEKWFDENVMALQTSPDTILLLPPAIASPAYRDEPRRISGQEEYLPASASLMGPRGSDLMLIQTIRRAFELAAWRTRVDTGRLAFPIGDEPRAFGDQPRAAASTMLQSHHSTQDIPAIPVMDEL
ncbi:Scytalone dehydratase-like protein Arp1 [Paramyrothecium foliicola]|nr:Scytalone dehydratase-like protein Arp1 [Paramyrothecium foliicola]